MKSRAMTHSLCLAAICASLSQTVTAQEPLDFGSDASDWNNDGECDDARFVGDGMADSLITDNIGRDASDCRRAHGEDRITLNPYFTEPADMESIDYGDNRSEFAFDGACDDIRFTGDYSAQMVYLVEDIGHDASDCQAAVEAGDASWQGATVTPNHGVTVEAMLGDDSDGTEDTI